MKIDQHGIAGIAQRAGVEFARQRRERDRRACGSIITRPMALITSTRCPLAVSTRAVPRPGTARGPVQRAQQIGLALDEDQRLALVEGVVAERHHIGAGSR